MPYGILGTKQGMTRIFQENGEVIPVTLIKCDGNIVSNVKTVEKDGYNASVVSFCKLNRQTKTKKFKFTREFILDDDTKESKGNEIKIDDFNSVESVNIVGVSKGKGFQGVIKRHNFSRGPMTHGSHHHRAPGSIGACAEPGRVIKGQKLPGRMGGQKLTIKHVPIIKVLTKENCIAIKGSIPGARNSLVILTVDKIKS